VFRTTRGKLRHRRYAVQDCPAVDHNPGRCEQAVSSGGVHVALDASLDHDDILSTFCELANTAACIRAARTVLGREQLDHMWHVTRLRHRRPIVSPIYREELRILWAISQPR